MMTNFWDDLKDRQGQAQRLTHDAFAKFHTLNQTQNAIMVWGPMG